MKLAALMEDPSFDAGITRDSIVKMIRDVSDAYLGRKDKIYLPQPVHAPGPAQYMLFKDDSSMYPTGLKIRRSVSSSGHVSRRTQTYKTYHGIDTDVPISEDVEQDMFDDRSVIKDVEYMIEKYDNLDIGNEPDKTYTEEYVATEPPPVCETKHLSHKTDHDIPTVSSAPAPRSRKIKRPHC